MITKTKPHAKMTARKVYRKAGGWRLGVVQRQPSQPTPNGYNPLTIVWSVNKMRKDYIQTREQHERKGGLPSYSQSLFDNCFKKW